MFNQRPTTLLGLEPRRDANDMSFLTPSVITPEYLKLFTDLYCESQLAGTPTTLNPNLTLSQYHLQQQQQHHQQQQQLHQQQLQQQQLQQQQQLLQHDQQQQQQQIQPNQTIPPPLQPQQQYNQSSEVSLAQHSEFKREPQHIQPILASQRDAQQIHQLQQPSQQQPTTLQIQQELSRQLEVQPKDDVRRSKLSDDERLRNKRERNRKAAANCRRRKDEKLKKLEEENQELRRTIESLQAALNALQSQNNQDNS